MPLQATSGAASYDAFGGGVPVVPAYIEEVFSTYLYTGNGSTQTITNGIDLSGKGGLVWTKSRAGTYTFSHRLVDTVRGSNNGLRSNGTFANQVLTDAVTGFTSTGYTLGSDQTEGNVNYSSDITYVSWTFREQPKFFDVVTWTGNGVNDRAISHALGSTPGCIIIKRTDNANDWYVYHRSLASNYWLLLNSSAAQANAGFTWTTVSSTSFTVPSGAGFNASGGSYVAYVFAHNAGGFGLTGTDNVISCGSFTAGSNSAAGSATINLGYEPQWILTKNATGTSTTSWQIYDNMRGCTAANPPSYPTSNPLNPNNSNAESSSSQYSFNSTGFVSHGGYNNGDTIIYIAIRRGPMKVPTSGTSVFTPIARTGTGSNATVSGVGFPPDLFIGQIRGTAGYWNGAVDRLRGVTKRLVTSQTNAEDTTTDAVTSFTMDGSTLGIDSNGFVNESGKTYIEWNFKRAPSFFDEVCYTGTGSATTFNHNLGVAPELMIIKKRSASSGVSDAWLVYSAYVPNPTTNRLLLNGNFDATVNSSAFWNSTAPTSSVFTVGTYDAVNYSGSTYVAYLFATCAGVSKVGSYTGNGSSQTINCGFTGGARFVMIKATSTTGDWMVADSARGIVSGSDPYLELNNTNAEVTGEDWLDTDSTGFVVNEVSGSNANTNGVTYIYLAIA